MRHLLLTLMVLLASTQASASQTTTIQLWHQMIYSHREVLKKLVDEFERINPGTKIQVTYRETEELRSAFQSASMAGSGPELIYGPSDQVGPFATMNLIRPLDDVFSKQELSEFDPLAVVKFNEKTFMLGNTVGNFLMLIYNKKLVPVPPKDLNEFIKIAQNLTKDFNGDGKIDQFGLAFNFTEPFFLAPWVDGFGEHFLTEKNLPNLNSKAMIGAFSLMRDFRDKYKIIPKECDYEMANSLFKEGKAAMIINGDWSWGDYKSAKIDFGIARLPLINQTNKWPAPLVGTAGYSLNSNISNPKKLDIAIKLVKFLTTTEAQLLFTKEVSTYPSRYNARKNSVVTNNEILKSAADIMAVGKPMPVVPEVRAVWDSLRGQYQSVLAGTITPEAAALKAQNEAEKQIERMNEVLEPNASLYVVALLLLLLIGWLAYKIVPSTKNFIAELKEAKKFPYLMMLPAFISIFAVIIYPFFYNLALSVSNFSLKTFNGWKLIGLHHYWSVIIDPKFYEIFLKTILWTLSNVFFHVTIGVLLAVIIEQVMPKKNLWRTLLIIPWAVPQYITALTWRGMFNQEYGPINIFLQEYLKLSPIQWLSQPWTTFSACVVTNVWLGFPFMMIVALGGLQSIPPDLYESAKIDGANSWQRFRLITWPMLQPVIRPAALLGCIWTFNTLNVIWLVSNSGEPADQTHILVSYVYKAAFNLYRYGYAAALSMIIFIILIGMTLAVNYINSNSKEKTK
jgi:arabinogalactan oligomer/maltooligosaccharide transport system permease protein